MTDQIDTLQQLEEIQRAGLQGVGNRPGMKLRCRSGGRRNLGRSSPVMQVFSAMGKLPKEQRQQVGQAANQVKVALESAQADRAESLRADALRKSLEGGPPRHHSARA